eukprot:1157177-Pelagomonas_calceolata.AAC.6
MAVTCRWLLKDKEKGGLIVPSHLTEHANEHSMQEACSESGTYKCCPRCWWRLAGFGNNLTACTDQCKNALINVSCRQQLQKQGRGRAVFAAGSSTGRPGQPAINHACCRGHHQDAVPWATTDFPATDQALFMHACRLSAPCKLLHSLAGGAGPAPHSISKLPCLHLSIHAATHTIVRTKIKKSHRNWNHANSLAQRHTEGFRRLTVKFPEWATPQPRTQQGHPLKYVDEFRVT